MKPALRQVGVVFGRELRKTFFARRGLWIYLLAAAPFLLFFGYTIQNKIEARQRLAWASEQQKPLAAADFATIKRGMTESDVQARLGNPARRMMFLRRRRAANDQIQFVQNEWLRYSDGSGLYYIVIQDGKVVRVQTRPAPTLGDLNLLFATVFQFFYLRLAVFFGCLGIFMNLFRGELLDKSLHFYFLAPVRRELVLAGKFLAGLAASVVIFAGSAALQLALLGRVGGQGLGHFGAYLGVTALACLGYGAVFLAAGLMFKNPIAPAVALLLWESLAPFLPAMLKKLSVIYYLTQLCPVSVASGPGTSPIFALLVSAPDPISRAAALVGLLLLAALVLAYSARRVRRLEIDYTSE
ncbi:MAG TPA: ABC transporter permease subunit [Terriglobales bacterium]|nr:ABC transporter permease subunit [Terriglobales bacterium]